MNAKTSANNGKHPALIVDDSFLMRCALRKILELNELIGDIDEAENGETALEKVKQNHYDLILLDIEMPVMDGIEFMKRCKLHTDAKVIIVSSLARINSPQVEEAVKFGAFDVMAKPTGILKFGDDREKDEELLEIVSRSIESKK